MPIPAALLPAIISGGAQLFSQGFNAISQASANRQQRKYNEQMYQQQRKDSLSDWNMQNKYGSPQQQMQRLQEAGLNPHLVYGKGTIDNFAGSVRSSDAKQFSPTPPRLDVGQAVSAYADVELKRAQTDNLRNAIETSAEQRALIKAQALKTAKDTDYTTFRKMRDELMLPYQEDAARENLRKTRLESTSIAGANERAWQVHDLMKLPNLQEALARIGNINAQTETNKSQRRYLEANADNIRYDYNFKKLTQPQELALKNYLTETNRLKTLFESNTQEARQEAIKLDNFLKKMQIPTQVKTDILKVFVPWY